ncbi:Peroxisomal acyl-coenzyme A oxidase 3 [Eumeta japonica]|uniref:Peroxisomal acyl-coenzyme A oxidase 3 n=1 Tax=Eumeta variegata TaxID=151549 RepID=A0A4C1ZF75_EUMVA|nr:Peroxisomal acyl-coenzyme A oxidase 3 [Eumeta japonica]
MKSGYTTIIQNVENLGILASVALTEIAHGSDVRLMRTTATYDPQRGQFVIHTPDFQAAKCWVGNLGFAAKMYSDIALDQLHAKRNVDETCKSAWN